MNKSLAHNTSLHSYQGYKSSHICSMKFRILVCRGSYKSSNEVLKVFKGFWKTSQRQFYSLDIILNIGHKRCIICFSVWAAKRDRKANKHWLCWIWNTRIFYFYMSFYRIRQWVPLELRKNYIDTIVWQQKLDQQVYGTLLTMI